MTYLQVIMCRKVLIAGNLRPAMGGTPLPESLKLRKLPTACISHESFTLALDRNDG
jgi:hypothetical protein